MNDAVQEEMKLRARIIDGAMIDYVERIEGRVPTNLYGNCLVDVHTGRTHWSWRGVWVFSVIPVGALFISANRTLRNTKLVDRQ